nr:LGFP repeat [Streptococcus thermophilus]
MNIKMNRKLGASVAALALATGLAACSDDADNAEGNVEEVEATETNTETVTEETDAEGAGADENAEGEGEDGETVEITTQDGETVLVPAAAHQAAEENSGGNWGDPFNVESREDGTTLIEYDADKNIVYSEETGGVPLVGEIANTWKEEGGLDAEIGLPTEAEEKRSDDNGWIQNFQNGTIEWLEENGEFGAKIS